MTKSMILLAAIGIMLIVGFSLVIAQGDKNNESAKPVKNMTYGQCVSAGAVLKNSCYNETKNVRSGCMAQSKLQNDSAIAKSARAQCNADYKTAKKECKRAFKSAMQECRKIKHNFIESVQAEFI